MSVANAWASAYALSMVMWFNHQIVVGQCLVMDMENLLFKPLLLRVLIMSFQTVSFFFCHSALHMDFGRFFSLLYTSQVGSMSSNLSCLRLTESTPVVLSEFKFLL